MQSARETSYGSNVTRSAAVAWASYGPPVSQGPPPEVLEDMRQVGERISQSEQQVRDLDERVNAILLCAAQHPPAGRAS